MQHPSEEYIKLTDAFSDYLLLLYPDSDPCSVPEPDIRDPENRMEWTHESGEVLEVQRPNAAFAAWKEASQRQDNMIENAQRKMMDALRDGTLSAWLWRKGDGHTMVARLSSEDFPQRGSFFESRILLSDKPWTVSSDTLADWQDCIIHLKREEYTLWLQKQELGYCQRSSEGVLAWWSPDKARKVLTDTATAATCKAYPQKKLDDWYKGYVKQCVSEGTEPSREEDHLAAKENGFPYIGREAVRDLRKRLAPATWKQKGRRNRPIR